LWAKYLSSRKWSCVKEAVEEEVCWYLVGVGKALRMVQRLPNISVLKREVSTDFPMMFLGGVEGANASTGGGAESVAPAALSFGARECSGLSLGDRMDSGLMSFLSFPLTPKMADQATNNDRDSSDDGEPFQGSEALASTSNYDMAPPRYQDQEAPLMTREISNTDLLLRRGVSSMLNDSNESSVHNVSDPLFFAGVKVPQEAHKKPEPVLVAIPKPPTLQREPSRTSERLKTPTLKRKTSEAVDSDWTPQPARASKRAKTTKKPQCNTRGQHVKDKPEMHQRARAGQEHWGKMVQDIRTEWQRKRMWEKDEHYSQQISMCTRRHIKSQHECFLRLLQMCKIEGIVQECVLSNDEENSFCGWVAFKVNKETGSTFRNKVANMFPGQCLGNTLNNAFRRAGIIPEANADETKPRSWEDAWNGKCAFEFQREKRATYS